MSVDGDNSAAGSEIQLAIYNFEKRLNLFHVGILVYGKEFHFGVSYRIKVCNPRNDGKIFFVTVWNVLPRKMGFLRYEQIVAPDGRSNLHTELSFEQIVRIKDTFERWRFGPESYRLFRNNCLDFAFLFLRAIATNGSALKRSVLPTEIRQPWLAQTVRAVDKHVVEPNKRKKQRHILQLEIQ